MDEELDHLWERVCELELRLTKLEHHKHIQSSGYGTGRPFYDKEASSTRSTKPSG